MKRLAKDAVVAERTVQAAAVRLDPVKKKQRRSPVKKPTMPTVHIKVNPLVWTAALALCEGNGRRIEVIAADSVVVHNQPRR